MSEMPKILDVPKLGTLAVTITDADHAHLGDDPRPRKLTRPFKGATVRTPEGGTATVVEEDFYGGRDRIWLDDREESVSAGECALMLNLPDSHWKDASIGQLTVRGVTYNASCHMHRWTDGTWRVGPEFDSETGKPYSRHSYFAKVHATRADGSMRDASESAREKMRDAIEAAFATWADANGGLFMSAGEKAHAARIARKRAEVAKAREALAAVEAELVELETQLAKR